MLKENLQQVEKPGTPTDLPAARISRISTRKGMRVRVAIEWIHVDELSHTHTFQNGEVTTPIATTPVEHVC